MSTGTLTYTMSHHRAGQLCFCLFCVIIDSLKYAGWNW